MACTLVAILLCVSSLFLLVTSITLANMEPREESSNNETQKMQSRYKGFGFALAFAGLASFFFVVWLIIRGLQARAARQEQRGATTTGRVRVGAHRNRATHPREQEVDGIELQTTDFGRNGAPPGTGSVEGLPAYIGERLPNYSKAGEGEEATTSAHPRDDLIPSTSRAPPDVNAAVPEGAIAGRQQLSRPPRALMHDTL